MNWFDYYRQQCPPSRIQRMNQEGADYYKDDYAENANENDETECGGEEVDN